MSSGRKFVFVLSGSADIDHMAPVMWQCLVNGQSILALVASQYKIENDFRLRFLSSLNDFQLKSSPQLDAQNDCRHKLLRPLWNLYRMKYFLRRHKASLCVFQWGDGIWSSQLKPKFGTRFRHLFFADFVLQMQYACRSMGIPTACLPHGHSIKMSLIRGAHIQEVLDSNNQKLPFSNRNSFAKYVFASAYHRDVVLQNSDLSSDNVEVWGSARFSPEWTQLLYQLSPPAGIPPRNEMQRYRVLFFIPKWHNLVDRDATIKLLSALAGLASIQLTVRGHVRGSDTQLTKSELSELESSSTVFVAHDETPSTSLIAESDVLIDVDSSIAFDAISLGKLYIRPRYLQHESVKTVFDQYGGALQADSQQEILEVLSGPTLPTVTTHDQFQQAVIGDIQSNIPLQYFRKLSALGSD